MTTQSSKAQQTTRMVLLVSLAAVAALMLGLSFAATAPAQDAGDSAQSSTEGPFSGSDLGDGPMTTLTGEPAEQAAPEPSTTTSMASTVDDGGPSISSDKADYAPGSTVVITGRGWPADTTVTLRTDDELGRSWSDTGTAQTDGDGGFTYSFVLPEHFVAQYTTSATDGTSTATTTFTDAGAALQGQSSPVCSGGGGGCDGGWEPGNLSGWSEGELIPMRLKLTGGFANEQFQISYDRTLNNSSGTIFGVDSLKNFVAGTGVTITTPTICDNTGGVWAVCFRTTTSGTTNNANPKFITFNASMAVGARGFTGSSMAIKADLPSGSGTVQIAKPVAGDIPPGSPDLTVTKTCTVGCSSPTGPNTAPAGSTITYRIDYSNLASGAANAGTNVVLRDILDDNESFVSCSSGCSASGGSPNVLTWNLGSLAGGAGGFVTVQAQLPSGTGVAVVNEGNIATPQIDAAQANNISRLTTTTSAPGPVVHTTSTTVSCSPNPIAFGGSSICTATVSDTAASGKTVPTGTVTFNNGTAGGSFNSTTCTLAGATSSSSTCSVTYTPSAVGTGTHAIGGSYAGTAAHSGSSGSTNLTVQKAAPQVNITWNDSTYNGTPNAATATVNGGAGATLAYYSGATATGTPLSGAPTNAGTYTVRASFAGNGDYTAGSATKTITIAKAAPTVNITWNGSTYDGTANPASVQVDGVNGETDLSPAATLAYYSGSTATGTPLSGAPTDAGTYTVKATFAGNGNYNGDSATKTITIDKATPTVNITWSDSTYDGEANSASATVNGVNGETDLSPAATLAYYSGSTATGTPLSGAPTDAGTYTVKATFAGNGNYGAESATKTITIGKAAPTIDITWSDSIYNGDANWSSAQVDGIGSETDLSPAATLAYYSGSTATGTPLSGAPTDAGTYTVKATFAGNGNYGAESATKTITIGKAAPTIDISWSDSIYNGDANSASAQVDGIGSETDLSPAATLAYYSGSTATGTPLAGAPTNAGTYTVKATFAGNGNYDADSATKTITIGKAASTVNITWSDSTFNGTANSASATVDGTDGETDLSPAATLTYYSGSDATGTALTGAPTNAGTYTVKASFAGNGNYNADSATKTITIGKAAPTIDITWSDSTYDGEANSASAMVNGVNGETNLSPAATLAYYSGSDATGAALAGAPTNAGTYTVKATFAGNGNYGAESATKTITIGKAAATIDITWSNSTYDGDANSASATVNGVNGETDLSPAATLAYYSGSTATGTPLAGAPTNAGTYTVKATFAGNGNYNGETATKTITIGKAAATIDISWSDSTYNGSANSATATVDGVDGETDLSPAAGLSYYSGSDATGTALTGAPTNAGTYTVKASFAGNGNYEAKSATKTITIAKAAPSIDISWSDSTYDGDANSASATVNGVNDETDLSPGATLAYYSGATATGTPLAGAPTNAGTYTVKATFAGNGNYNGDSATKTITIDKATPTVEISWSDSTYNGSANTASATTDGVGGETNLSPAATLAYYSSATATGTPLSGAPTDAGTYTVKATFAGNGNYNGETATKTITIGKAAPTIDITWSDSTYNGTANSASATVDGVDGETDLSPAATLTYYSGATATGTPLAGAPTDAGTYTVKATFAGNGNYDADSATKTITIGKAAPTIDISWSDSTYDGEANSADGTVNGVNGETGLSPAATLAYYSGSTATGTPLAGAPTNAGTYTVKATFAGNGNYDGETETKTITIAKAAPTVNITWSDSTYDGSANTASATTDSVDGETNLSPAATLAYYSGATATGTPLSGAPTNAGTYTVKATFAGNGNYNGETATKTITIAKAASTVKITWSDSTYDGEANSASATVNGVNGETDLSPAATLAYYSGATATGTPLAGAPTNAGTYTVKATFAGNGNYDGETATKTITIGKAAATIDISWSDSTYNGSANSASATVNGVDGETDLSPGATLAYYSGATATGTPLSGAPTNAGTYTVKASFAGNGNYDGDSATKTITIGKAAATIDITWSDSTYNGEANSASATVNGVDGETDLSPAASLSYYSGSDATGTALAGAPTNAGTYTVKASFAGNGNYNGETETKTITIGKATPTVNITWSDSTYNGTANSASAQVDGVNSQTDLSPAATLAYYSGTTATGTPLAGAPTDAGTYTVKASFAGNGNYNGDSATKTITIGKAAATIDITWSDSTYNGEPNSASATVNGVNGETDLSPAAALTYYSGATATGTPLAGAPTNAGTYTVKASFAGNDNYNGETATKTITIDKATPTVKITWLDSTYDGEANSASATVNGVDGETDLSPAATLAYYSGTTATGTPLAGAPTNAGTYTVKASFAGDDNYNGDSATKTITINKAAPTVKITWSDSTYNGSANAATATVDGIDGETDLSPAATLTYYEGSTATGTALAGAPKNAGTYTVKATFAGNGNYNGDSATKPITIAKATPTVKITWSDSTYNGSPNTASATTDGVGGETNLSPAATLTYYEGSTATGTALAGAPKNAGTYTVKATFDGNGNYNGDSATKTITIAKAAPTVKITWSDSTYNGSPNTASATTDGVGGETNLSPAATLAYYSGTTATGTPLAGAPTDAGTYTVKATFAGNGNYNDETATKTITIGKATAGVTLTVTPSSVQYSDKTDLKATISPAIAGTVQFRKSTNGGTTYADVGSPVTAAGGIATLNNQQVNDAPGTSVRFKAVFSPADSANYNGSADDKPLAVTQEDAGVTYTGPEFLFTPSVSTGAVTVPFRATIQDPTALATGDPLYDGSAGDIRNASVTFVNRDSGNAPLCTASLSLVDAADTKTAIATCSKTIDIGAADSSSMTIGVVVGNHYVRNASIDNTVLTISKPIATQFITGGGYLLLDGTSAGTYKGDAGSKNNFGFNVRYNSKGTNLQGRVNTIIRRGGRVYQVKANNLLTLGVSYCKAGSTAGTYGSCTKLPVSPCTTNASSTCPIQATFTGSANAQDVTNPTLPVSIEGGATVQLDMVDFGEPGSNGPGPDQMGITVLTKTSSLWYSSRWSGTRTAMQLLNGGNLVVH